MTDTTDTTEATDTTPISDDAATAPVGAPASEGPKSGDGVEPVSSDRTPLKPRTRSTAKLRKRKLRLAIAGVILIGAFVFLLVQGLTNSLNYFLTVNQAVAQKTQLGNTTFRLEGLVVPGTVHPTTKGVNFTVESSGVREAVVETGQPPQLFQPDIPVVLVGHFSGPFFASDQILVDHTAQYIAKYPNRVKAPNGTVR
jgi:cytochrome c-type biogenesis protein CcmE